MLDPADDLKGHGELELDVQEERTLRGRLGRWSRAHGGVAAQEFDDLYQDAWCRLLVGHRHGHRPRSVEGVLRWALRNAVIDEQRRQSRRQVVPLEAAPPEALTAGDGDPAERVELLEATRQLLQGFTAVTERQREIVLLADLGDVAPAEVQRRLGISARTYRRDHASARRALGACLENGSARAGGEPRSRAAA